MAPAAGQGNRPWRQAFAMSARMERRKPSSRPARFSPRAPHGLAVDRDHVAVLQQSRHVGRNFPEGGVQRPGVDHAEDVRERVMRRGRMLQHQEVSERKLSCRPNAAIPAQELDPRRTEATAITSNSPRSCRALLGDVVEGGQDNLHRPKGSMRSPQTTESRSRSDAGKLNNAFVSERDSPACRAGRGPKSLRHASNLLSCIQSLMRPWRCTTTSAAASIPCR